MDEQKPLDVEGLMRFQREVHNTVNKYHTLPTSMRMWAMLHVAAEMAAIRKMDFEAFALMTGEAWEEAQKTTGGLMAPPKKN